MNAWRLLTSTVLVKVAGLLPHWDALTVPLISPFTPGASVRFSWQLGLTRAPEKVMRPLLALAVLHSANETAPHANAAKSLVVFFMMDFRCMLFISTAMFEIS
jgi:hypothetical protein